VAAAVLGIVVGWITNALGMWLIFEPTEPKRYFGIKFHGLFLRRQDEAAEVYAKIIADDVITLERIGDFLMDGPRGDRTRQMLATRDGPAIDQGRRTGARRRPHRDRAPAYDAIKEASPARPSAARSRRSRTRSSQRQQSGKIRTS
jgi:hypothetical protein